jgi:hypothetical protein
MPLSTIDEGLKRPRAVSATVSATSLRVTLQDGREVVVPVEWFEWLARGSISEQNDLTIIEDGAGIVWNQLDDSLSVPRLLGLPEFD